MKEYVSLGYLVNTAARLAKRDLTTRMQSLGLTFPQWLVLKDISNHENGPSEHLTMAAIARRLNTNRPNIMGMMDRLTDMGLVRHTVNPDNRRAHIVSLTDQAKSVMNQLQELSRETSERALQGFNLKEQAAVRDYLTRIIANLHEPGYYDYYLEMKAGTADETD